LLELGFVHICKGNTAGMFAKSTVRQLDGVVMTGFNCHPCAVGIEGFTGADAASTFVGDAVEILFGSIQQRTFVPAV
jgi:hypothetical protein